MSIPNNRRLYYAPLPVRPRVTWPGGKQIAFWHAPNVEHYDWVAPGGGYPQGRVAYPDAQHYMHRDAGNRVGLWRMLRVIDEFAMPSTVSLSLLLLEDQPEVREAMFARDWEVELLERKDILAHEPRFSDDGVTALATAVYRLQRG